MTAQAQPGMRGRGARRLVGAAAAVGAVALCLAGSGADRAASASGTTTTTAASTTTTVPAATALPSSVTLNGEGTYDVDGELLGWQNALYGTSGKINLNYLSEGGQAGREDLLAGAVNFAIAGAPYTASELAGYKPGAKNIIAAPIMPSGVGFLLNPPASGFYVINGQTGNPSAPYTGPVREPAANVVAQALHYVSVNEPIPSGSKYPPYQGATSTPYAEWDDPSVVSTWDSSFLAGYNPSQGDSFQPYLTSPQQVVQAESNEDNLYLDEWAKTAAPTIWNGLQKTLDPNPSAANPFVPSEQPQPTLADTERPGLTETVQAVVSGSVSSNQNLGGILAPVPPSSDKIALTEQAANEAVCKKNPPAGGASACDVAPVEWINVPNKAGQWEIPSPQAIDAAVDASPAPAPTATTGVTPLWATTHAIKNAYPITYVDYLYAPATGLSIAQTEGLATVIRYLVTDGQSQLASNGDGRLSATLVNQALASANALVSSDCPAAGGQVVTTSQLGAFAPNLPGLRALGKVEHCTEPSATTTPTTTPRTTPPSSTVTTTPSSTPPTTLPPVGSPSGPAGGATGTAVSGSSPTATGSGTGTSTTPPVTTPPRTTAPAAKSPPSRSTSSGGAGHGSAPPTKASSGPERITAQEASALPLPVTTGSSGGLDKLGALIVGVLGYLLLRKRIGALISRVMRS